MDECPICHEVSVDPANAVVAGTGFAAELDPIGFGVDLDPAGYMAELAAADEALQRVRCDACGALLRRNPGAAAWEPDQGDEPQP